MTITDFSALSLKLPLLDRGTLSQAWRDALHLAHGGETSATSTVTGAPAGRAGALVSGGARTLARPPIPHGDPRPVHAASRKGTARGTEEAASPRSMRKQAACLRPMHAPTACTSAARDASVITLPNGERLCLVVSQHRQSLRITVLCPSHLRDDVRASLAQLRLILARLSVFVDVASVGGKA